MDTHIPHGAATPDGALEDLRRTTLAILTVAGVETGIYVLEERLDGTACVVDEDRHTDDVLGTATALLRAFFPATSFTGQGWVEGPDDPDPDYPFDDGRDGPFLGEVRLEDTSAHAVLRARQVLDARVAAAGPEAVVPLDLLCARRTDT